MSEFMGLFSWPLARRNIIGLKTFTDLDEIIIASRKSQQISALYCERPVKLRKDLVGL